MSRELRSRSLSEPSSWETVKGVLALDLGGSSEEVIAVDTDGRAAIEGTGDELRVAAYVGEVVAVSGDVRPLEDRVAGRDAGDVARRGASEVLCGELFRAARNKADVGLVRDGDARVGEGLAEDELDLGVALEGNGGRGGIDDFDETGNPVGGDAVVIAVPVGEGVLTRAGGGDGADLHEVGVQGFTGGGSEGDAGVGEVGSGGMIEDGGGGG